MPTHKTDSNAAIKKIKKQDESSKLLKTKIKGRDKSSKLLKKYYKKPKKDVDIDIDDIMKEINEQEEKNKLLEKQKNEQDKILKQQNDEQKKLLEEQKKKKKKKIF